MAANDIRTAGLSVRRERVRKRIRYRAEQSIVVTVRDVSKLGPLLDAVASAGADGVGEPDYGFADPSVGPHAGDACGDGRRAPARRRRGRGRRAADHGRAHRRARPGRRTPTSSSRAASGDSGGSEESAASAAPTQVSGGTQQFIERVRVVYTAAPAA